MSDYGWYGESHYDYEPPEPEESWNYPEVIAHERVFRDGYFYDVFVMEHYDASVEISVEDVYYTCWDGELPF